MKNKASKVNERKRLSNKHNLSMAKNLEKKLKQACIEKKDTPKDFSQIKILFNNTVKRYCKTHLTQNKISRKQSQLYKLTRSVIQVI